MQHQWGETLRRCAQAGRLAAQRAEHQELGSLHEASPKQFLEIGEGEQLTGLGLDLDGEVTLSGCEKHLGFSLCY